MRHCFHRMQKHIIAFALVCLMLMAAVEPARADVGCMYGNFDQSFTLVGDGGKDMVAVALKQIDKTGGQLGYYRPATTYGWCAAFVNDCAVLAGQQEAVPFISGKTHDVKGLYDTVLARSGTVVSSPIPGDLIFFYCKSCGSYPHVGIYVGMYNGKEQWISGNINDSVVLAGMNTYRHSDEHTESNGVIIRKYVRPAYKTNLITAAPSITGISHSADSVTVSWKKVANAVAYSVYAYTDAGMKNCTGRVLWAADASASSKTVSRSALGLSSEGGAYYFAVAAEGSSNFKFSATVAYQVHAVHNVYSAPVIQEIVPGDGSVTISWSLVDNAERYDLFSYDSASAGDGAFLASHPDASRDSSVTYSYKDLGIAPDGGTYWFRVDAVSAEPNKNAVASERKNAVLPACAHANTTSDVVTLDTGYIQTTQTCVNCGHEEITLQAPYTSWSFGTNAVSLEANGSTLLEVTVQPSNSALTNTGDPIECWINKEEVATANLVVSGSKIRVLVDAVAPGWTQLNLSNPYLGTLTVPVYVRGNRTMIPPANAGSIEDEAMANTDFDTVMLLGDTPVSIGSRAFADNAGLTTAILGDQVTYIADDAFDGCPNVRIFCNPGSCADAYAQRSGLPCIYPGDYKPVLSDWVFESEVPEGAEIWETRQVYRYRDYSMRTEYSNWSSWGGYWWDPQPIEDPNLKQQETAACYIWYWFSCSKCGWHYPRWGGACGNCGTTIQEGSYSEVLLPLTSNGAGTQAYGSWRYYNHPSIGNVYYNTNNNTSGGHTSYRYRTRTAKLVKGDPTEWSAWMDSEPVGGDENREVETATMVTYVIR